MKTVYQPDPKLDLCFTRVVDVPRSLVWRAWTEPEHMRNEAFGQFAARAAGAAERLLELLTTEPRIAAPPVPATLPEPARGAFAHFVAVLGGGRLGLLVGGASLLHLLTQSLQVGDGQTGVLRDNDRSGPVEGSLERADKLTLFRSFHC